MRMDQDTTFLSSQVLLISTIPTSEKKFASPFKPFCCLPNSVSFNTLVKNLDDFKINSLGICLHFPISFSSTRKQDANVRGKSKKADA